MALTWQTETLEDGFQGLKIVNSFEIELIDELVEARLVEFFIRAEEDANSCLVQCRSRFEEHYDVANVLLEVVFVGNELGLDQKGNSALFFKIELERCFFHLRFQVALVLDVANHVLFLRIFNFRVRVTQVFGPLRFVALHAL